MEHLVDQGPKPDRNLGIALGPLLEQVSKTKEERHPPSVRGRRVLGFLRPVILLKVETLVARWAHRYGQNVRFLARQVVLSDIPPLNVLGQAAQRDSVADVQ